MLSHANAALQAHVPGVEIHVRYPLSEMESGSGFLGGIHEQHVESRP